MSAFIPEEWRELEERMREIVREELEAINAAVCPHCGYDLVPAADSVDGPWAVDVHGATYFAGERLPIGPSRSLILSALLRARGNTLSEAALRGVIGSEDVDSNVVSVQICKLRSYLRDSGIPSPVETVRGFGYRWQATAAQPSAPSTGGLA